MALDQDEFVKAWNRAKSVMEVAVRFRRRRNALSRRAAYYRKEHGVWLKHFKTGPTPAKLLRGLSKSAIRRQRVFESGS